MDRELPGSGASNPRVTVYTITYNQRHRLRETLEGLFAQDYPVDRFEIVVNDDGSTDGTRDLLGAIQAECRVPLTILCSERERSYMSARRWNQCLAAGSKDSPVLIQLDDVRVRPDFIRQHVKWHRGGRPTLVTGAKFEGPDETWCLSACRRSSLAGPGGAAREVEHFTAVWGASLSFSRALMEAVYRPPHEVPYDERMEGWGFHEVELACRMREAGARIVYDPAAGVFHRDHAADEEARRGLDRREQVERGSGRNTQYLLNKHRLEALPRW